MTPLVRSGPFDRAEGMRPVVPLSWKRPPSGMDTVDYAQADQQAAWLRHPVLGELSFDAFARGPANPIYRGAPPLEWPVNGFLFEDPRGGGLFAYVGRYARDYAFGPGHAPSDCWVLRSRDGGESWEEIGPALTGPFTFAGENNAANSAPDCTVVYAEGRYHLVYDWVHDKATWADMLQPSAERDSGVGYAVADRPEGPFMRAPQPLWVNLGWRSPVPGKYRRLYASTLLRRETDWLLLTLSDSGDQYAWGLYALTAARPEGPWSEPRLVLSPEGATYHPPLMEFYPQFAHAGRVYAPATSLGMSRGFQALWSAPLAEAHRPLAWRMDQHGSLWHREPREEEYDGIWGQTWSGAVDDQGKLRVLFPSRDSSGRGTINVAHAPWQQALRARGGVIAAGAGPVLTALRRVYGDFHLDTTFRAQGEVMLRWGWTAWFEADRVAHDAAPAASCRGSGWGLDLREDGWRLWRQTAADAEAETLSEGDGVRGVCMDCQVSSVDGQGTLIHLDGLEIARVAATAPVGLIGWWVKPRGIVEVERFHVRGESHRAELEWGPREALLGTGVATRDWPDVGATGPWSAAAGEGGRLKWNFLGTGCVWMAPRGPHAGRVAITLDGESGGEVDLSALELGLATEVFRCENLPDGGHALVLRALSGRLPVGYLRVLGP